MIEYKNVYKSYRGGKTVINDLCFTISEGEIVVLVGESGCGKTTTMRMLNRLIDPTSGTILINNKDISTINPIHLRRRIGYVIQDVGLFPHWTIEENIATLLTLKKVSEEVKEEKVRQYMELVNLDYDEFAERYPKQLSGGQQQRVGVARALIDEPDILLMDEPFSALDPITREQLQDELIRIHDELHKTIIFVTHDIDEAIKIGDRIAVMQNGSIAQFATPEDILKNPANEFVEQFVGSNRLWKTPDMLTARDIMEKDFPVINQDKNIAQAIELMKIHRTSFLCVANKGAKNHIKLFGFLGRNRIYGQDSKAKIKDIMKTDFKSIDPDTSLTDVMNDREENQITYNPVIDKDGYLLGLITDTSILNVLHDIMPGKEDY
jgi:osmoprotectant transport system ATP-binding protein